MAYRSAFLAAALAAAMPVCASAVERVANPTSSAPRAEPVVDRTGKYPGSRPGAGPSGGAASRVYIDPKTREIIDRPLDADPILAPKSGNFVDYTIRASEEGYLFIDTSEHLDVSRATLNADGELEYSCGLDHDHTEDAR